MPYRGGVARLMGHGLGYQTSWGAETLVIATRALLPRQAPRAGSHLAARTLIWMKWEFNNVSG